jgi:hypothetical protein
MKKIILITLTLISMNSFAGLHMTCEQVAINQTGEGDVMTGLKSSTILSCKGKKQKDYTLVIKGYGLGVKLGLGSVLAITCPTVSERRLNRVGKVSLGSVKATASVFLGADAVVAVNHRGGTCMMVGFNFNSYSAGVSIGKMTIFKGDVYDNQDHIDRIFKIER